MNLDQVEFQRIDRVEKKKKSIHVHDFSGGGVKVALSFFFTLSLF